MAHIHPSALVDPAANLADTVTIGPFCIVGPEVTLGAGTTLVSHVTIANRTTLGENNTVHAFSVLGQTPQDLKFNGEAAELVIGNNNSFRESVTISIGTAGGGGATTIGDDNLFMANAHAGHDCHVGSHCVLANCATLGGHVTLGDHVIIGGLSAVHQFVNIGRQAIVGGVCPVIFDVPPFLSAAGNRAALMGLNLVGLKRRGHTKPTIRALSKAYKQIFEDTTGSLVERAAAAVQAQPDIPEIAEIQAFIARSERGVTRADKITEQDHGKDNNR